MSVRFRLVNMFDSSVSTLLATECQKYSTRWRVADEARAEHHVGPVFEDRLDQPRILGRVVFQVGVLHEDHVAGGVAEALRRAAPLPWLFGW